jgi:hypothetical protein
MHDWGVNGVRHACAIVEESELWNGCLPERRGLRRSLQR